MDREPPPGLSAAERSALRARAHRLDPVVLVGGGGLTAAVVAEVDRALAAHELIKVRVMGAERSGRAALLAELCAVTSAAPVQHIGKILVLYRKRPPAPTGAAQPPQLRDT